MRDPAFPAPDGRVLLTVVRDQFRAGKLRLPEERPGAANEADSVDPPRRVIGCHPLLP